MCTQVCTSLGVYICERMPVLVYAAQRQPNLFLQAPHILVLSLGIRVSRRPRNSCTLAYLFSGVELWPTQCEIYPSVFWVPVLRSLGLALV